MLTKSQNRPALDVGGHFGIVAGSYNARHVDAMIEAARARLQQASALSIEVVRVPGAYEIPLIAATWARTRPNHWSALICLGVIIRGQTAHAQLIGEAVTRGLMETQLTYHLPIIHEVLLVENEEQADKRCLDPEHNRGLEAAETALHMTLLMRALMGSERRVE
jgi:6,7-dimethyl-8-ribityllumazine synthase